ncbi:acylphosphatase [Methanoculleus sp. Afa-1]|uniref:acylphosphatase n=1 Tax=Methanoculleus formosensis TaxID=2590886 RepID=A0A9E4ZQD2_9EURY|nr:acylphosphatase [Methanoculleus sp. Afa-1]MCT8338401.1 acylphosphatase [Methanoculleus sp. Afa-1]
MKRFVATARGRVQRVSYREHVYNETFERNISGYVMNLKNGDVEIVAEGSEEELRDFINAINIIHRPIAVKSFTVRWEEATGEYADFEIVRGEIQEEIFERMDYAGNVLHSMDMKLDQGLQISKETLQVGKETLQVGKETLQVGKETLQVGKETLQVGKETLQVGKETLQVGKETLQVGKETLQVGKETLQIGKETKEEIVGLRSDTKKHLDDEFAEIRKELVSIKDALARAGIQV